MMLSISFSNTHCVALFCNTYVATGAKKKNDDRGESTTDDRKLFIINIA